MGSFLSQYSWWFYDGGFLGSVAAGYFWFVPRRDPDVLASPEVHILHHLYISPRWYKRVVSDTLLSGRYVSLIPSTLC